MNCVLIQDNKAHQIWANTNKSALVGKFTPEVLNAIVETSDVVSEGFTWNGTTFTGQQWLIITATGEFVSGGFNAPAIPDASYSVVQTGNVIPNRVTQKWNGSAVVAKTAQEITAFQAAAELATFTATSLQKDVLATCALIVRAKGVTAWNNMTLQQKKDATLAEAGVWVSIRQFVENSL